MTQSRIGPEPQFSGDLIEDAAARLHEAIALLEAIDQGSLLSELPANRDAARRHQCGVSLLGALRRELDGVLQDLLSASDVENVMARVTAPGRTD